MRPASRNRLASHSSGESARRSTKNRWMIIGLGCAAVSILAVCSVAGVGGLLIFGPQFLVKQRTNGVRPIHTSAVVGDATRPVIEETSVQPATDVTPAVSTPLLVCEPPTLTLGPTQYRIESIPRTADNSLTVPPDSPDVAYWLEGTPTNRVFGLSPTPNNLALSTSLKAGDEVTFVGSDCTPETYVIKAVETGQLIEPTLFDQAAPGIILLVQTGPNGEGLIIRGSPAEVLVIATATPPPPGTVVREAEVSFLEKTVSPDGQSLRVGISILNYGAAAFTVSAGDVSLTPENAAPLAPLSAEPVLPHEVGAGTTETFYFTFPQPASGTAVLQIFDIEFDVEDF